MKALRCMIWDDLKSDCMSEKTPESSLDHDFGFSCHGVSSVCLGEATRGIGGASDVVFQNGSFGLVGSKYVPERDVSWFDGLICMPSAVIFRNERTGQLVVD